LGLAIARELVEAMHGKIRIESVPGSGTTATVELESTGAAPR
jgi:signal transduction histidine kinase